MYYIIKLTCYLNYCFSDFLKEPLEKWLKENLPGKHVLLRLTERMGLIYARQEGAKAATGDVIVVLDSHCEVLLNWLPPLLGKLLFS